LNWLEQQERIETVTGGDYQIKIKAPDVWEVFSIHCSHPKIPKSMVVKLMKFLTSNEICTEEEFLSHL